MVQNNAAVGVKLHHNVQGKPLYYLLIQREGKEEIWLNVGEKTYKGVLNLFKEKEVENAETPAELPNMGKKKNGH